MRTDDPAFFPNLDFRPAAFGRCPRIDRRIAVRDDNLGAFRGLAYAIVFQSIAMALGFACWEVLRRVL